MVKLEYQRDSYSCGSHAFKNSLALIGFDISLDEAKRLCKTSSYIDSARQNITLRKFFRNPRKMFDKFIDRVGTDEKGIKRGLKKLGIRYKEYYTSDSAQFIRHLERYLKAGPAIILFNFSGDQSDTGH